ncbi:MAG: hypothetical protein R3345_03140 [Fulvivirga sp.]|nr:hypothetical protein [Fulvivirga sp.]
MATYGDMRFVPSPTPLEYKEIYSATANESGRMQYHRIVPNHKKERITRNEFVEKFNTLQILAVKPLPVSHSDTFQFEFYV